MGHYPTLHQSPRIGAQGVSSGRVTKCQQPGGSCGCRVITGWQGHRPCATHRPREQFIQQRPEAPPVTGFGQLRNTAHLCGNKDKPWQSQLPPL